MEQHPGRRILLAVVMVVVAWAAFVAVRLIYAAHQLDDGVHAAGSLRPALLASERENNPAERTLAAASEDFAAVHRTMHSAWLAPLLVVPEVGRQVRAVDDLSGAAAALTTSAHAALGRVQAAVYGSPPERRAGFGALAGTLTGLDRMANETELGPSKSIWPSIARRRNALVTDLQAFRGGLDSMTGAARTEADLPPDVTRPAPLRQTPGSTAFTGSDIGWTVLLAGVLIVLGVAAVRVRRWRWWRRQNV